jgi:hypothetical protein
MGEKGRRRVVKEKVYENMRLKMSGKGMRGSRRKRQLKSNYVRFEVSTAVTMKNAVFWEVTPCGSCKNRRFGGT